MKEGSGQRGFSIRRPYVLNGRSISPDSVTGNIICGIFLCFRRGTRNINNVYAVCLHRIMKVLLFANTDWYLYNFRLALAKAMRELGIEVVMVSPRGDFGELLRTEGFRWIPVSMDRLSFNPLAE